LRDLRPERHGYHALDGSNAVICPRDRRIVGSRGSSSVCMPSRRLEQPIVAVAVAEDPACVDMVDGRLIENLHVDDARRGLAWADAIAKRATHRLTLRRQTHGETDREGRRRYWRSVRHRRGHSSTLRGGEG